jgi:hypothetical protein
MSPLEDQLELAAHSGSHFRDDNPADEALLALLAYMASSDGDVHDRELAFLGRLLPDRDPEDLRLWALGYQAAGAPDIAYVCSRIRAPEDHWTCLRFAARMAWKDGSIDPDEQHLLDQLVAGFGLPASAVERVLREMAPFEATKFARERIIDALRDPRWDTVQMAGGPLVSPDLLAVMPADATIVVRLGIDRIEVAGLGTGGIVARFRDGPAFVSWDDLVSYTRSLALGAALTLHTEDGRAYHFVDARLGGLAMVFDRLFGGTKMMEAEPTLEITIEDLGIGKDES